jgi:pseudaminic acid cytidylyltransferase
MRLAVIPARGGSKRIVDKNIRQFHGKPIIAYSIEAALEAGCFDRVIVSTDSDRIARLARQYGAETPFMRPAELSDDYCGTMDVVRHAILFHDQGGTPTSQVCCIYPTAPLLTGTIIREGLALLELSRKRFVFTAMEYEYPLQRALLPRATGGVAPMFPEHIGSRSQDLEKVIHDAGQLYWGDAEAYRIGLPMFAEHAMPLMLERWKFVDIDTEEDWRRAELMYALHSAGLAR